MRNGPQSISMFRLSSIALGFLAVAAFAQNARATPIFATQAELTTAFGGPDATLDWQAFAPIVDFSSSTQTFVTSPTVFTVPTIGDVTVSSTGTLQRRVAGDGVGGLNALQAFPGAFTPNTGAPADREQLLHMFGGTRVQFDFSEAIGGFGTTLQTNTGGGAPENTFIQAFSGSGNPIFAGPDTSGWVSSPGDLGTTAFLGASSTTNEITRIIITSANNNFAINSPTFFMNSTATGVPEPGTWLMVGLGSLLYGVGKRRKKKNVIVEETV